MTNKAITALVFFLLLLGCTSEKPAAEIDHDADFQAFSIRRGTNIAHWLSQSDRRGDERASFFTQQDVTFIDSVGFDHIRLPVDEQQLWDENGNREEDAFALLE